MIQLTHHFASKDRSPSSERLRQQRWFIKAREDQERREKDQDRLEDDFAALVASVTMATEAQIAAFTTKLDSYDEATVKALMDNQEILDAVNARIDAMLERAYVMEDGRRAFRTEDGTQVFDQTGIEIMAEELDPDLIDPLAPTWEAFGAEIALRDKYVAERTEIIEYQVRLDAAREQAAGEDITEVELGQLDAELVGLMPTAIQKHVPGMEQGLKQQPMLPMDTQPGGAVLATTTSHNTLGLGM